MSQPVPPPATPTLAVAEPVIALVLDFCARHEEVGGLARSVLGDEMPRLDLAPAERRVVAQGFYRLLRLRRRVEFALQLAGPHLRADELGRAAYFVALVLDGQLSPAVAEAHAALRRGRIDWTLVKAIDDRIAEEPDPVRRFGLLHSVPDWLAARFLGAFGSEAGAVVAGLNQPPPLVVRANTLRTTREALREAFAALACTAAPTPFAPHGLVVEGDVNLFASPPYRAGLFEQQDEASQLCALVVAPPPRGNVLDACAGSGGKTLALAAAMQNRGSILATDVSRFKLQELVQRRRRAGIDNVRSLTVSPDHWPDDVRNFAGQADRILVDAPCDGVGSWRRRPDARWRLRAEHLDTVARKQRMLLERAAAALQPGARVVYATCTIFREQNEDQVDALLAKDRDLEAVPVAEILGKAAAAGFSDRSGRFLRTFPHLHGTDGFFAAVLRRRRIPRA